MKSKKDYIISKIVNYLLNVLIIIFGIILLISIYNGIQTKAFNKKYTDFFGYSIFEVQTGSMADTINAGDWIIVNLTKNIKLNDIVTYESHGEYITHRVIAIYGTSYITMGDANNDKDDPIKQEQVIGKVATILPNFGIVRQILFNPFVLIALLITLFLFSVAFKRKNEESNKNYKQKFYEFKNKLNLDKTLLKFKNYFKSTLEKFKIKRISEKNLEIPRIEKVEIKKEQKVYDFSDFEDDVEEEDEIEKTTLFRVIPVDASEIDDTFLEIAKNEINESDKKDETNLETETNLDEEEELESNTLTKINLDLLNAKKSRKIGKNIVDTVLMYKIEELEEIIDILIENEYYKEKPSVKNLFVTTYIDAKYYNYYGDRDIEYNGKNLLSKIEEVIKEVTKESILNYKGKDLKHKEIVDGYQKTFKLIASLEQAKSSITDLKIKKKFYKKEILKYNKAWNNQKIDKVINEIIKIQRNYIGILDYFLKKLETNMFELKLNQLSTKKNIYGVELNHNIVFSKVYSDYIIDKTYTDGIIAEDKTPILFTLLLIQLVKDMNSANFNKKYIINLPSSLYLKEKKIEKFLKLIDDKYAKENIVILITFDDLLSSKKIVKELRKKGYKFALVFEKDTYVDEKDSGSFYLVDYIFVNKKIEGSVKILSIMPKELLDNIIYEDIVSKVGELGSE